MNLDAATGILTGIPYDWLALGGLIVVIALDSLRSGIGRACAIALALPIASVLYALVEQTAVVGGFALLDSSSLAKLATFGVMALAAYLLVRRMSLEYVESGQGEPIQALLAGGAATVVLVVVWLQLPMSGDVWQVSDNVRAVFAEQYRLIWILGSYLALAFARG
jgi:hypothetical protein